MPKRKGLGQNIDKSLEAIDDIQSCTRALKFPALKKGLRENKVYDDKMAKKVNSVQTDIASLMANLQDLEGDIKAINPNSNNRFAGRTASRVVEKFLGR